MKGKDKSCFFLFSEPEYCDQVRFRHSRRALGGDQLQGSLQDGPRALQVQQPLQREQATW